MVDLAALYRQIDPLRPLEADEDELYVDWQRRFAQDEDVKSRLVRTFTRNAALHSLGDDALRKGRYDDAVAAHTAALDLYRSLGDRLGEANALRGVGEALLAIGRDDGRGVLEDAARIYRLLGCDDLAAQTETAAAEAGSETR